MSFFDVWTEMRALVRDQEKIEEEIKKSEEIVTKQMRNIRELLEKKRKGFEKGREAIIEQAQRELPGKLIRIKENDPILHRSKRKYKKVRVQKVVPMQSWDPDILFCLYYGNTSIYVRLDTEIEIRFVQK